jgi:sucrose-phosphate synthase
VALAMAALGHRVDILTRRFPDGAWRGFGAAEGAYPGHSGVRILRFPAGPATFLRKELLWPHLVRKWVPGILAYYARQGGLPDAFTGHYGDGGLCGALIEACTGVPFTFTAHSLGAQKMDQLEANRDNLAALNAQYHFARRIVAERLSMNRSAVNITSTRQEWLEQYGHRAYRDAVAVEDEHRFAVIPPGVNLGIFGQDAMSPDEAQTRAHVGAMFARDLGPERRHLPAIVASSRLDRKKNTTGLIRTFAQTPELQARANLVLFTAGLSDPLNPTAAAFPTGGNERFEEAEVLDELLDLVAAHDLRGKISAFALRGQAALGAAYRFLAERRSVFALTALYEPFGLAPLEAAAAGLPVVVTANGGPTESLREGETEYGILVDPADPDDIARGLLRLLADRETWETFARRGRQRVQDRYTWERTAEGYLAQIEAILAQPDARRPPQRLPVHPYFRNPSPNTDVTLEELASLYFG